MYLDANNLYGWAMPQILPVNGFKWIEGSSEFNKRFIKTYDENSDRGNFLEVNVKYPKNSFNSDKDLPFLAERKKLVKVKKQFNQIARLKPYIDINTGLRKAAKNEFEKDSFKLMNNSVFGKTIENVRKHRDINLVTTDEKRNNLVSVPNYHTTKCISENVLAIEMKKTKEKMNKSVYLGMSILDITKTLMYEFWYDYIKPKYGDRTKLC